ncbi:MAG: hypothetical protein LBH59_03240 [Planctomycetaceae bacterium]|nr:hypothetical protein [Planctomycetaceae bacterium]
MTKKNFSPRLINTIDKFLLKSDMTTIHFAPNQLQSCPSRVIPQSCILRKSNL